MTRKIDFKSRELWKKISLLVVILLILGLLFNLWDDGYLYRPFEDFNGPNYLPDGYNISDNLTDDNVRIFEYHGNGTIYAGVIKDSKDENVQDLLNPFKNDPQDLVVSNAELIVNEHNVVFKESDKYFEIDKASMEKALQNLPINQTMPTKNFQDVNLNMAKFQAQWYCPESNLTYVVTGLVTTDQIPEMKKVVLSMKCHIKKPSYLERIQKLIQLNT